jgi:hypothetical protein
MEVLESLQVEDECQAWILRLEMHMQARVVLL